MDEEEYKKKFIRELKEYLKQQGLQIEGVDISINMEVTKKNGEKMTVIESAFAHFLKIFLKHKMQKEVKKLTKEIIENTKDNS
jgi:predicted MPP superfamily phosphohydrolase